MVIQTTPAQRPSTVTSSSRTGASGSTPTKLRKPPPSNRTTPSSVPSSSAPPRTTPSSLQSFSVNPPTRGPSTQTLPRNGSTTGTNTSIPPGSALTAPGDDAVPVPTSAPGIALTTDDAEPRLPAPIHNRDPHGKRPVNATVDPIQPTGDGTDPMITIPSSSKAPQNGGDWPLPPQFEEAPPNFAKNKDYAGYKIAKRNVEAAENTLDFRNMAHYENQRERNEHHAQNMQQRQEHQDVNYEQRERHNKQTSRRTYKVAGAGLVVTGAVGTGTLVYQNQRISALEQANQKRDAHMFQPEPNLPGGRFRPRNRASYYGGYNPIPDGQQLPPDKPDPMIRDIVEPGVRNEDGELLTVTQTPPKPNGQE